MNQTQQTAEPKGIKCPQCGILIPVSIQQILSAASIYCPQCGLRLDINRQKSARAIDALRKVEDAQRNLNEKSHFNGRR